MDTVLKDLESKIEDLIAAYTKAAERERELAARVAELEAQLNQSAGLSDRVADFEKQRDDLAGRLEKVLKLVNTTLASVD